MGASHSGVSIHAPHAGRDSDACRLHASPDGFNPRAPCGAQPPHSTKRLIGTSFQSTRPMRGATRGAKGAEERIWFQSTRPKPGATSIPGYSPLQMQFQSTRPMRSATGREHRRGLRSTFQSTRPKRGATRLARIHPRPSSVSIHAPQAGRDRPTPISLTVQPQAPSEREPPRRSA